MPKVYNKHHKDAPPDAVYVGRPTKWGNPYSHIPAGNLARVYVESREDAVEKYRHYILMRLHNPDDILSEQLSELKGKDLVCWCAPKPCHADILLEIANKDA